MDLPLPFVASRHRTLVLDCVLVDTREASAKDRVRDPELRPGRPRKRPSLGAVSNVTVSGGLDRVLVDARETSAEDCVRDPELCPGRPRERPSLGAVSNVTVSGGTRCASSGCHGDW